MVGSGVITTSIGDGVGTGGLQTSMYLQLVLSMVPIALASQHSKNVSYLDDSSILESYPLVHVVTPLAPKELKYHLRPSHGVGAGVTVSVGAGVSGDGVMTVSTGEGVTGSIGEGVDSGVVGSGVMIISIGAGVGEGVGSSVGLQTSMYLHTPSPLFSSMAQHSPIVSYVSSFDIKEISIPLLLLSALSIPFEHFSTPSMSVMM